LIRTLILFQRNRLAVTGWISQTQSTLTSIKIYLSRDASKTLLISTPALALMNTHQTALMTYSSAKQTMTANFNGQAHGEAHTAITWGGGDYDYGYGIACDSINVIVTGGFEGLADFNPGNLVDDNLSNGKTDAYLVLFNK
jgi:hypothetical protein